MYTRKETYKRDLQKRPTKETYKRDLQKRPTKETYKGVAAETCIWRAALSLSLSFSLSLSHIHTHTYSQTWGSGRNVHLVCLSSPSLSLILSHTHTPSLTHMHNQEVAAGVCAGRATHSLSLSLCLSPSHVHERWGAGVETQKNVRGEIGGWGRVPFNEPYAPSLSTIYDGA